MDYLSEVLNCLGAGNIAYADVLISHWHDELREQLQRLEKEEKQRKR